MADYQLIIIGSGLSGIAAGIRSARFGQKTLILEQHAIAGGLNSYYYRQGHLLETGLHAMTNYPDPGDKRAPLNVLFRQLKLPRKHFVTREQFGSEIAFPDVSLQFSNAPELLVEEISGIFPGSVEGFLALREAVGRYDPFAPAPWRSTRSFLAETLGNRLLEDMLLLPIMVYGNPEEHDMDLAQFVIMFRALFEEGFFRPEETILKFLQTLIDHYTGFAGELRFRAPVKKILLTGDRAQGVELVSGEVITADAILSTAGIPETIALTDWDLDPGEHTGQMSFIETIALLPREKTSKLRTDKTIIFYNHQEKFSYCRPQELIDPSWGVICFPENFQGLGGHPELQIRVTNPASYPLWSKLTRKEYQQEKNRCAQSSLASSGEIIGLYGQDIVYQDSFTPLTIERFTRKAEGAVYGSPIKLRDGITPWKNLFIAGTDQGFLGIVGSMLSGVTIVNQHLLQ